MPSDPTSRPNPYPLPLTCRDRQPSSSGFRPWPSPSPAYSHRPQDGHYLSKISFRQLLFVRSGSGPAVGGHLPIQTAPTFHSRTLHIAIICRPHLLIVIIRPSHQSGAFVINRRRPVAGIGGRAAWINRAGAMVAHRGGVSMCSEIKTRTRIIYGGWRIPVQITESLVVP